eukprot:CAMPEP_0114168506 /NCGR_PEP_ID=MMETSP0043_2-20121206/33031_1 /TAXON_ID=464988 /ORGANISM="Hemiselmis andersenii, Strain CCMP644" /LENGTH=192 /DNA_ID=CAMNT_0001265825 /DNA_START=135 /DNA_END=710 /DNA_ORIENTATION=+
MQHIAIVGAEGSVGATEASATLRLLTPCTLNSQSTTLLLLSGPIRQVPTGWKYVNPHTLDHLRMPLSLLPYPNNGPGSSSAPNTCFAVVEFAVMLRHRCKASLTHVTSLSSVRYAGLINSGAEGSDEVSRTDPSLWGDIRQIPRVVVCLQSQLRGGSLRRRKTHVRTHRDATLATMLRPGTRLPAMCGARWG